MLFPDTLNVLLVFFRSDGKKQAWTVFISPGIFLQGDAVGSPVKFFHISHNLVMADVLLTNLETQKLFGAGDLLIVSDFLRKVVR